MENSRLDYQFFPPHHSYLEPFLGSGAVLFNKPRSNIETVNDLDNNVVNLFEWIKSDPERLAREIYYTPYARQVYEDAFNRVPKDSLHKAVNFYILLNMGHGFRTSGEKVGWKKIYRAVRGHMPQQTGATCQRRSYRRQNGYVVCRSRTVRPWNS